MVSPLLSPLPMQRFVDGNGNAASGFKLFTYQAGTTTKYPTYTDSTGGAQNTNPVVLNQRGEAPVWLDPAQAYKIVLALATDTDPPSSPIWTVDNVGTPMVAQTLAGTSGAGGAAYVGFDGGTLASFLLSKNNRVVDSIAGLRGLSKVLYTRAFVTGYYAAGDGGGGPYWFDPTDTTSADNGGTIIVASDGGRWKLQHGGSLSVLQFGAYNNNTNAATNNSVFASIVTFLNAAAQPPSIYFPTGIYAYSVSPNWAMNHGRIIPTGDVRLRYSGTGQAVILDGGSIAPNSVQDFTFGEDGARFTIEAGKGATDGCFARALLNGCRVNVAVRGCGTASVGIRTNWCVLTDFSGCEVAPYFAGWYNDGTGAAQPQDGFWIDQRNANEQTSVCCFVDCYAASCSDSGWVLANAQGNFIGGAGDSEFHTKYGMVLQTGAVHNRIFAMNFEANTVADILDNGSHNEFLHITSGSVNAGSHTAGGIQFGATCSAGAVIGGWHDQITVNTGAGVIYIGGGAKYASNGGTITDAGTRTRYGDTYNIFTGLWGYGPNGNAVQIVPGPSPWTYTNNTGRPVIWGSNGGTVSLLTYYHNGQAVFAVPSAWGGTVYAGDQVVVQYTVVPAVYSAPIQ